CSAAHLDLHSFPTRRSSDLDSTGVVSAVASSIRPHARRARTRAQSPRPRARRRAVIVRTSPMPSPPAQRRSGLPPEVLRLRRVQADAFLALTRIQRAIEQRLSVLFEAEGLSDVTPAQANALMILFQERRPLTARVLAGHMALSEVTVGRFVRAL